MARNDHLSIFDSMLLKDDDAEVSAHIATRRALMQAANEREGASPLPDVRASLKDESIIPRPPTVAEMQRAAKDPIGLAFDTAFELDDKALLASHQQALAAAPIQATVSPLVQSLAPSQDPGPANQDTTPLGAPGAPLAPVASEQATAPAPAQALGAPAQGQAEMQPQGVPLDGPMPSPTSLEDATTTAAPDAPIAQAFDSTTGEAFKNALGRTPTEGVQGPVQGPPAPRQRPKLEGLADEVTAPATLLDQVSNIALPPFVREQISAGLLDSLFSSVDAIGTLIGEDETGLVRDLARRIPRIEESDRTGANLVRKTAQLMSLLIPLSGAGRAATIGQGVLIQGGAEVVASGIADFLAFEPDEPRMVDAIVDAIPGARDLPYIGGFIDYIESNPNDSDAEARFKNVVEGAVIGGVFAGTITGARAAGRVFHKLAKEAQKAHFLQTTLDRIGRAGDPAKVPLVHAMSEPLPKVTREEVKVLAQTDTQAAFDLAKSIPEMGPRLEAMIEVSRRVGAGTKENLIRQAETSGSTLLEDLNRLRPGIARTSEEQAGYIGTLKTINPSVQQAAENFDILKPESARALKEELNKFIQLDTAYVGGGSEAGRTLQGQRVLNELMENNNIKRTHNAILRHLDGSPDELANLAAALKNVPQSDIPQLLAKTGAELSIGKKLANAATEAYASLLFTPKTLVRNVVSNILMDTSMLLERTAAASLAKLPFGSAGHSDITFRESYYLGSAMMSNVWGGMKAIVASNSTGKMTTEALNGIPAALTAGAKADLGVATKGVFSISGEAFGIQNGISKGLIDWMGNAIRWAPTAAARTDVGFKHIMREAEKQALMYREAVASLREIGGDSLSRAERKAFIAAKYKRLQAEPPERILRDADQAAHYATFTDEFVDETASGHALVSLQKMRSAHPLTRLIIPFLNTPARVGQAMLKRFPGLGLLLTDTQEVTAAAISASDATALKYAKQAVGAAYAIAGLGLWHLGYLTGSSAGGIGPQSAKQRSLEKNTGFTAFALPTEFDDEGRPKKFIPMQEALGVYAAPVKAIVLLGEAVVQLNNMIDESDVENNLGDSNDLADVISILTSKLSQVLQNQVVGTQVAKLLTELNKGNGYSTKKTLANMVMPNQVKLLAENLDASVKEVSGFMEDMASRWPGTRGGASNKTGFLGEHYIQGYGAVNSSVNPGLASIINRDLNPFAVQGSDFDSKYDPVYDFLAEHTRFLTDTEQVKRINGIKLTSEQQALFMTIRGGDAYGATPPIKLKHYVDGKEKTMRDTLLTIVTTDQIDDSERLAEFNLTVRDFTLETSQWMRDSGYFDIEERIEARRDARDKLNSRPAARIEMPPAANTLKE